MSVSILVPAAAAKKVLARLVKLARTAGVDVAPVAGTTTLTKDGASIECARYTIGELPRQSGYRFVARLQHEKDGNIVAKAPGELDSLAAAFGIDAMLDFRTAPNACSHCNVKRGRKETFVLRDERGQHLQIGRNCLADFLATDPAQIVAIAELSSEVSRLGSDDHWSDYYSTGGYWEAGTLEFVKYAIASVAARGFIKTQDDRGRESTKAHANFLMGRCPDRDPSLTEWVNGQPTPDHAAAAAEALEWAKNLDGEQTRSEYMWNLKLAAARGGVGKNEGILASLYSTFCRAQGIEQEKAKAAKPEAPKAAFAAEAGWIWKGEAKLVRFNLSEGDWGVTKICTFRSTDGFEIVWFASSSAPTEIGATYNLKGRVKRTEVRKGVHQTIISRASWSPTASSVAA